MISNIHIFLEVLITWYGLDYEQTRRRTLDAGYAQLVTNHACERGVERFAFTDPAARHEPGVLRGTVATLSQKKKIIEDYVYW